MPYALTIDRDQKRVIVIGRDPVALPDLFSLLDRQADERAWSYGTLHDARLVTWIPALEDVDRIAAYVEWRARTHGQRGPVAYVGSSAALFGMARAYASIENAVAMQVQVFRELEAAEEWLTRMARRTD